MTYWYGLDGQAIGDEEAEDLLRDIDKRRLACTKLVTDRGTVDVSTVFLVLDHNYSGRGRPVLWETIVFGGPIDQEMWRYRTPEEAMEGHASAVTWARSVLDVEGVEVLADETVGVRS